MGRLEDAQAIQKTDTPRAEQLYKEILAEKTALNDVALKEYEIALMELGGIYRDQG